MSRLGGIALRVIAPLLVVGLASAFAVQLVRSKPKPPRAARSTSAPLVEVMEVVVTPETMLVDAMGTVRPSRLLVVQPQVSGAIIDHHAALVPGGLIASDEVLVTIDGRDYELLVQRQEAQVARARLELRIENGRQAIAEREWETLAPELELTDGADEALARREPQVAAAEAAFQAAEDAVHSAQLNLDRTEIAAPFNAVVREEAVEVGQVVGPGYPLATLVGTDAAWIEVALPVDALTGLVVPGHNADVDDDGSDVVVIQKTTSGAAIEREGQIVRLLRDLDPLGRMARLIVEVVDPMDLDRDVTERRLPLLVGAFVGVRIQGTELEEVVAIPRQAMREGEVVWVSDADDNLELRPITVAWREQTRVLVSEGLEEGDRVILSPLAAPVAGMALRVQVLEPPAEAEPADGDVSSDADAGDVSSDVDAGDASSDADGSDADSTSDDIGPVPILHPFLVPNP
ncbi:MAG: efflux RND transporter periplasmic adaptor subunit [Myxococcota bacterium]|nr:efflux RND transporter periplasmic adaptor subunit [Myxococcota bacterium]